MNMKLEKKAKNYFEKDFFMLINNSIFGKTMGHVRKQRHQTSNNRNKKKLFDLRTEL